MEENLRQSADSAREVRDGSILNNSHGNKICTTPQKTHTYTQTHTENKHAITHRVFRNDSKCMLKLLKKRANCSKNRQNISDDQGPKTYS